MSATSYELFEAAVSACGLPLAFGRSAVERACFLVGVEIFTLNQDGLALALPYIRRAISRYLSPEEIEESMDKLTELVRWSPGGSDRRLRGEAYAPRQAPGENPLAEALELALAELDFELAAEERDGDAPPVAQPRE
jgi:hypothetical protein